MFGVLTMLAIVSGNVLLFSGYYLSGNHAQLADLVLTISIPVGFILALCVGISNFDQDMTSKTCEFWRSRPIHVDSWFWIKFLTGLTILVVAIVLPAIVALAYAYSNGVTISGPLRYEAAWTLLSFYLAIYAAASATIIVIRQPIYAAILGVGALLIGIAGFAVISETEFVQLERVIYVIEFVTALLATLVAWLAIRYDWGANGRS
jgi:ABC-type transport system involved in multi-copper enzyme maturation permease subunit